MKGANSALLAVAVVGTLLIGVSMTGGAVDEDGKALAGEGLALNPSAVPAQYQEWIMKAGKMCPDVPAALIAAQIEAESNWNPKATSPVGAQGLSQFMPGTWATWKVDADGDGRADPFSPPDAIMTQARYDCWLADKVRSYKIKNTDVRRLMLAAYNAGPGAVQAYGGVPPYVETQQYVARILQLVAKYSVSTAEQGASEFGARVVAQAQKWAGTPYSWGGGGIQGPTFGFAQGQYTRGFDCSSLLMYAVYHASGGKTTLSRTSQHQVTEGKGISRGQLRPGDAIGFKLNGGSWDHIAIYIGNNQMIHAPRTGRTVSVEALDSPYWSGKPQTYRRYG
ncbi:bifunctional lytic transglycosylase/C40 family peptidase [Streptomyces parvus]|uniref:bifunctional lytic transglycosylase/C40 family peptidase n=1 Tax=Streptomyces parvus TaxID=66428 RepID=UPI0033D62455